MFNFFKRNSEPENAHTVKRVVRSFIGARNSAMATFQTTYAKINQELKTDYIALTLRARDLVKNNEIVASYINLMIRNVLGSTGFTFAETAYNDDGTPDRIANKIIEECWYDYSHSFRKYVSADCLMNELEFDRHVLFNFLVDGEVFIRKIKDAKSKYGVRWQVIDALDVDFRYNVQFPENKERICMGVKVDEHYKPISYFVRENLNTDYYNTGAKRVEIPASEMVHLYRKQYAGQIRGYTPLAPVIQVLAGMETYKTAEINASLLASAYMGVWEKTGSGDAYSQYSEEEVDSSGNVAEVLESGVFRYAPDGYNLKSIQSTHPNTNVGSFIKAMLKGVASALGISSNKLNSDYESVNYSSLRQANQEDVSAWKELQQFLIDGWKDRQFAEWLKHLLLTDLTNLPFSKYEKFLVHDFRGRSWEYLDPQKEYNAIKLKLELKLTNPIVELEKQGLDVDDILDGWQLWNEKLKARGIPETATDGIVLEPVVEEDEEDVDDSTNNSEV